MEPARVPGIVTVEDQRSYIMIKTFQKFQLNTTNLIKINIFVGTKFLHYGTLL
jgi:hypothetical protein